MTRCLVCGTTWESEALKCSRCGTDREMINDLNKAATRHDFLFGRIKADDSKLDQQPPATSIPIRQPRKKASQPRQPVAFADDLVQDQKTAQPKMVGRQKAQEADLIKNRDAMLDLPSPNRLHGRSGLYRRGLAHLIDVGLCMILNLWIFKMMLWFSGKETQPLLDFSLIPVGFVLLIFTSLYFWLFLSLMGKSLGQLILDRSMKKL